jgi:hypothetical protein
VTSGTLTPPDIDEMRMREAHLSRRQAVWDVITNGVKNRRVIELGALAVVWTSDHSRGCRSGTVNGCPTTLAYSLTGEMYAPQARHLTDNHTIDALRP